MRIGHGYDVHKLTEGRKLILGGVDIPFEKGLTWMDAGTADSLLEAAEIIKALQKSGQYIGCIEEAALKEGFASLEQIRKRGEALSMTKYGQYLLTLK